MASTKQTGDTGELLAAEFLENKGLRILESNVRTRFGEIDIIAADKKTVVIVEVRAKNTNFSGLPIETVNYKKQQKVLKMARWYLSENKIRGDARIDVVGITFGNPPQIQWVKNAVENN